MNRLNGARGAPFLSSRSGGNLRIGHASGVRGVPSQGRHSDGNYQMAILAEFAEFPSNSAGPFIISKLVRPTGSAERPSERCAERKRAFYPRAGVVGEMSCPDLGCSRDE